MEGAEAVKEPEKAIEAILFAAGYPVSYDKLAAVTRLQKRDIKTLVKHMAQQYESRGIQLLQFPDTCQLSTKEEYAPYIREALGINKGGNLSAASLEVLAIIAYNQPVTRSFIESLRGADCSYTVSSLIDKELIEAAGRLDAPGRPMLYVTTDKFLRVFGLSSLSGLPETEAAASLPTMDVNGTQEQMNLADNTTDKANEESVVDSTDNTEGGVDKRSDG